MNLEERREGRKEGCGARELKRVERENKEGKQSGKKEKVCKCKIQTREKNMRVRGRQKGRGGKTAERRRKK